MLFSIIEFVRDLIASKDRPTQITCAVLIVGFSVFQVPYVHDHVIQIMTRNHSSVEFVMLFAALTALLKNPQKKDQEVKKDDAKNT